jgi:hypothetical protein
MTVNNARPQTALARMTESFVNPQDADREALYAKL